MRTPVCVCVSVFVCRQVKVWAFRFLNSRDVHQEPKLEEEAESKTGVNKRTWNGYHQNNPVNHEGCVVRNSDLMASLISKVFFIKAKYCRTKFNQTAWVKSTEKACWERNSVSWKQWKNYNYLWRLLGRIIVVFFALVGRDCLFVEATLSENNLCLQ